MTKLPKTASLQMMDDVLHHFGLKLQWSLRIVSSLTPNSEEVEKKELLDVCNTLIGGENEPSQ